MSNVLRIRSARAWREVRLDDYLDAASEDRSHTDANQWIKQLRNLQVDGDTLRRRFTIRGDSLWWFTELYFHKQQLIRTIFRTIAGLESLVAAESPTEIEAAGSGTLPSIVRTFATAHRLGSAPSGDKGWRSTVARLDARGTALAAAAYASRLRQKAAPASARIDVAAFVHRAFWRSGANAADAESYIGPVLAELAGRLSPSALLHVGVGPRENFQARRWWRPVRPGHAAETIVPIEQFAPAAAMRDATRVWTARHRYRKLLCDSSEIREHSIVRGCDCWPMVRGELAGVALLQWPWSARAMDEAAAALEGVKPGVAITYAEAGGWGRALMLEARRRRIPTVGLQHGFIYRHWLNYRHAPDEMRPDPVNPRDLGFPAPNRTLLFDGYAAHYLEEAGGFDPETLTVTGSPRLDALASEAAAVTDDDVRRARESAGASGTQALVAVFTKYREAASLLPALIAAVSSRPDVQLVIKAHPAETADVYAPAVAGASNVRVAGPGARLAPLLRASRAIVTVNSTVALDAAVVGVPALVLGSSGNLQPFVEAGLMAGARSADTVSEALTRILYDGEFRRQLEERQRELLAEYGMRADGNAAARSADAILELVPRGAAGAGES